MTSASFMGSGLDAAGLNNLDFCVSLGNRRVLIFFPLFLKFSSVGSTLNINCKKAHLQVFCNLVSGIWKAWVCEAEAGSPGY